MTTIGFKGHTMTARPSSFPISDNRPIGVSIPFETRPNQSDPLCVPSWSPLLRSSRGTYPSRNGRKVGARLGDVVDEIGHHELRAERGIRALRDGRRCTFSVT